MRSMRMESFRDELSRIRESIADAFKDHAAGREVGPGASTSPGPVHLVPARLTIMDVMEGNLATVLPESTLRHALTLMIENRISSVPVVDAERRIRGALNEKDLMQVFYEPHAQCVADVMTHNPSSVSIASPIVEVIDQLMSSDFRRVLVHEDRRLVGVITRSHVMPALLEALEEREAKPSTPTKIH
jgi:CBS domain-containing protein